MDCAPSLDLRSLPKELNVLLLFMNAEGNKEVILQNKDLLAGIDWDFFVELARHHRVFPTVYKEMKELGEPWIPARIIQILQRDFQSNTFLMLQLSGEMEYLGRAFEEREIPLLILKGPVLAADLYGDISLRTSCDLDVLVPLRDLPKAEKLLAGFGYVKDDYIRTVLNDWKWRHHHVTYLHPQKGIKVEVHWRLNPGPAKEPSFNELWERRRRSPLTSCPTYLLGTEDLFLFLVSHGARHGWSRLRWLADIGRITRKKVNWPTLKRLLKNYQYLHIGGQALILCANLLELPISESMKPILCRKSSKELAQAAIFYLKQMVNLHTDPLPQEVEQYHKRHLFSLMSWRQKTFFLLSFLFPYPEDAETLPLPKSFHLLYFPLRPFLWAWRKTRNQA